MTTIPTIDEVLALLRRTYPGFKWRANGLHIERRRCGAAPWAFYHWSGPASRVAIMEWFAEEETADAA